RGVGAMRALPRINFVIFVEYLAILLVAQQTPFRAQLQAMQTGFDSQLKALTESVNSWKSLWEASQQEIRELKAEIRELRIENDKLRAEILELKGQLKEHYKLA
ncbi:MAG: hypothetical protein FWC26_01720, partial [Fibromonadales bacterium]|nr:hypothetical protein [Fibromonadales bacterium]